MKKCKNGYEQNNVRHMEEFDSKREKVKSEVLKIESVLNNSSELHLSEFRCSSPILSAISCCSSGAAGTPGTPVDIKSVLQVRQLSCKKLIYSYTFGSNCADCGSNSSCDASPNFFTKSSAVSAAAAVVNRSPTTNSKMCARVAKNRIIDFKRDGPATHPGNFNYKMAFSSRSPRPSYRPRNDRISGSSSSAAAGGSLNSRFSSMAAERISSSSRPSLNSSSRVSKASTDARRHPNRNDRGMEIDQIESSSASRNSRGTVGRRNNPNPNNNNRNRIQGNNRNNTNRNDRNQRKPQTNQKPKKSSLNQSDLDKELESYMMKNESTARNTLDMELDSYMSAVPSKSSN